MTHSIGFLALLHGQAVDVFGSSASSLRQVPELQRSLFHQDGDWLAQCYPSIKRVSCNCMGKSESGANLADITRIKGMSCVCLAMHGLDCDEGISF